MRRAAPLAPPRIRRRSAARGLGAALAAALVLAGGASVLVPGPAGATTIGYWRMEVDDDPSAAGLSTPNEVAFGTALVSAEATLDGANLPTGVVPLTFSTNASSLGATAQGGANGINAAAAWYPELAVTSITVEFWARTVESVATPFRMSSGGLDGIVVTDPNSLDVTWHVDVGGTPTRFSFSGVDDMDAAWSHYAFVYDEVFGVATFYVDGLVVATFDGPDGAPLVLLPGTAVEVGVLMDYASAGQGTIDELRISNAALGPSGFLVPEPSTGALVALGTAVLAMRRGSRPRRAGAPPRR